MDFCLGVADFQTILSGVAFLAVQAEVLQPLKILSKKISNAPFGTGTKHEKSSNYSAAINTFQRQIHHLKINFPSYLAQRFPSHV